MVALVVCIPCQSGDCDHCQVGHTQEGVLGGWRCPCNHNLDKEDTRNIIDHFKYWKTEAVKAALDKERRDFAIAMFHINYDINLGAIVRNANAFSAKKVYYIGRRQWDRRGAVGTHHYIDLIYKETFQEVADDWNGPVVALEDTEEAEDINTFDWPKNALILVGQESTDGIPGEVLEVCDHVVYIPQFGSVRSLNVACASAVAMNSWTVRHN